MGKEDVFEWIRIPLSLVTSKDFAKFVKIGTRSLIIDYPNDVYISFINSAMYLVEYLTRYYGLIGSKLADDLETLYAKEEKVKQELYRLLISLKDRYNKLLMENGIDWFKLWVRRAPRWSKSRFIIGYRVDRDRFRRFLEKISREEMWNGSLPKIYDYINNSKYTIIRHISYSNLKQLTDQVYLRVLPELGQAERYLSEVEIEVSSMAYYIRRLLKAKIPLLSLLDKPYYVLKGIEIIIGNVKSHLDTPPMVYRELRKVLEHLARIYFELRLLMQDLSYYEKYLSLKGVNDSSLLMFNSLLSLIVVASDLWDTNDYYHEVKNAGAQISSFDNLINSQLSKELLNKLNSVFPSISKKKLVRSFKKGLSWSMLLTIGSFRKGKNFKHVYEKHVYGFSLDKVISEIIPLSASALELSLKQVVPAGEASLECFQEIQGILYEFKENYEFIIPYPTISFLMHCMDSSIGKSISVYRIYNNYSYFVHPYLNSIEYYPCLLYTSPSPRDLSTSRMPSSA